jgi:uncharacterized sulfatase
MPRQAIFFLVDTQGTNAVGCYAGRRDLKTPQIDRLAAQGVRFNAAYTCSPVCGPARSAIFTGLYPHSNGVLGNNQAPQRCFPTLGERLQGHGVHTAYIGKWHLDGTDYFGSGQCPPGWDPEYWFDGRNYLESLPDDGARDLSRTVLPAAEVRRHGITEDFTHAHRTADRAIAFIREHRDEDFFLVVSIDEPHHPYICPEPFVSGFDHFVLPLGPGAKDTLEGKPQSQREWAAEVAAGVRDKVRPAADGGLGHHHPLYFACNSYCDYEVGRVLAAIETDVPESMIVYTADHGDMCGAHQLINKGPAMYEEITRVPLIVRWRGEAKENAVAPHPVSHIDLVPTFLEFFGMAPPPVLQGASLLSVVWAPETRLHDAVFIEFNRYEVDHDGYGAFAPIRCAYDGRYKLAVNLLERDEFYDHASDPAEVTNLIERAESAEARDRLHDAVLEWMGVTRDPLRGPHWARRPWRNRGGSTWGGPTRPRRFDSDFLPDTLLYASGREVDRWFYEKG